MSINEQLKFGVERIKFTTGLKQAEIADKLGIKSTYLSDMINGRVPLTDNMKEKIYEVFSYSIDGNILKGKNIQQIGKISGSKHQLIQDVEKVETHYHADEGKDMMIKEQSKEVTKMFEALLEELHSFHAISKRRDDYVAKQDEYLDNIVKNSYLRNERNMERIDKLIEQQNRILEMVIQQNERTQNRADAIVDVLTKIVENGNNKN